MNDNAGRDREGELICVGDVVAGPWTGRPLNAHSPNQLGNWHRLEEHLESVAGRAGEFAEPFAAAEWGRFAGLWHDVGKASSAFQEYLEKSSGSEFHSAELRGSIDHTSAGAQYAVDQIPIFGHLLAYPLAGHHSGLLDGISDGASLHHRLTKSVEPWQSVLGSLPACGPPSLPPFLQRRLAHRGDDPRGVAFSFAFFVRMLFSCLVDADFLDTEAFLDPQRAGQRPRWPPEILGRMNETLDQFIELMGRSKNRVDRQRAEVRRSCLAAAEQAPGFFSLTVPTGGGKTLSSLAFALRHSMLHGFRRIIYVVPFTSIIEQNADVFRTVFAPLHHDGFPDPVVEHHSALDYDEESYASRLAAENWDSPLVVTTAVQFYESLFANRSSRCRKLHNLSRSVIVLDEVQKIPVDLLAPCLAALRELVSGYSTTVVLCTATQPALDKRQGFTIGIEDVREIVPDPQRLYVALKRVNITDLGSVGDRILAERLLDEKQVLCVVNTRAHAREVFQLISGAEGAIHLSAAMCPAHRAEVLEAVRERLETDQDCRVVATQLIEAGVDIDFPVVFRSLAGLDSIAQAAGRCNRNGRRDVGTTFIFRSQHGRSEAFLRDTVNAAEQLLGAGQSPALYDDPLALEAIEHYFQLYFWDQRGRWDAKQILSEFTLGSREDMPFLFGFRTVAERFKIISETGRPVLIPWGPRGEVLCAQLKHSPHNPAVRTLRALQRFTVQVPIRTWNQEIARSLELVKDRFAVLLCPEINYDHLLGLVMNRPDLAPDTFIT